MVDFEIRAHSLAGRIGRLRTNHGKIETPTILPVINPNSSIIAPFDLKKYGAQALITNSYILWKDFREEAAAKGVHNLLEFDGPIMTDSGAFQLMEYGDIDVSNEEIIEFQKKIGVDIGVILDIPVSSSDEETMAEGVKITIERAKQAQKIMDTDARLWAGPIQGNVHTKLLKKCANAMKRLPFQVHPIGSVVPLLREYRFAEHIKMIRTAKEILPKDRPIHLFGAGHPMFFSFAVAMGCDLFDSAAYAIFARERRYLTNSGTLDADGLEYMPCSCSACNAVKVGKEMTEKQLAEHNLYATFREMNEIKQHINEGTLFELLEQRASAHPAMYAAMKALVKEQKYLSQYDAVTGRHFLECSEFSKKNPIIKGAKERSKRVKSGFMVDMPIFGKVSSEIYNCFPFSQSTFANVKQDDLVIRKASPDEEVRGASKYWYGADVFPEKLAIKRSPRTGRIREVYEASDSYSLLASVRANDFMLILHGASKQLHAKTKYPAHRIAVDDDEEVHKLISQGKNVFAKHVAELDKTIKAGQCVLVVTKKDELLASGTAMLAAPEIKDFDRGMAVEVRWVNKSA
ncbi:MAG: tRNA guanosine(15) transglycosylase TgtA [Candidatus Micrarchaeota archaeon]